MIVVCDASPLNILVFVGEIELLPKLFAEVIVPPAVVRELTHQRTPDVVSRFIRSKPNWLVVRAPTIADPLLTGMGAGEIEAIRLGRELKADLLLVDDRKARRAATARGLAITGTLGVLDAASQRGLVQLSTVIPRLRATMFRIADKLIEQALRRSRAAKGAVEFRTFMCPSAGSAPLREILLRESPQPKPHAALGALSAPAPRSACACPIPPRPRLPTSADSTAPRSARGSVPSRRGPGLAGCAARG